jgi:hypothetical protein
LLLGDLSRAIDRQLFGADAVFSVAPGAAGAVPRGELDR